MALRQDNKYYNADELLSQHYTINMICGDRYGGKSTCVQRYTLKRAIQYAKNKKNGGQFAVLVRYDKDKKILCETYFNNTLEMFYKDYDIKYERQKFYLINKKAGTKSLVGYCFSLNEATKRKSTSYPHITTIILEEFLNVENKYITSKSSPELEVEYLISLYSTIARGNGKQVREDVKVFLISNNYYINNPYFKYFNLIQLIIDNPLKRFYRINTAPKVILETTHNDIKLDIAKGDTHKGSKYADLTNELQLVKNPAIKHGILQLTLDNNEYITVANYNDSNIVLDAGSKKRDDCMIFSCSDIKKAGIYHIDTLKGMKQYRVLLDAFNNNWLYYDKLETYLKLYNILHF